MLSFFGLEQFAAMHALVHFMHLQQQHDWVEGPLLLDDDCRKRTTTTVLGAQGKLTIRKRGKIRVYLR